MKKEMDKIADYLLLRSSYMQELGLFHGKMVNCTPKVGR